LLLVLLCCWVLRVLLGAAVLLLLVDQGESGLRVEDLPQRVDHDHLARP
jgi:hypothetical protein